MGKKRALQVSRDAHQGAYTLTHIHTHTHTPTGTWQIYCLWRVPLFLSVDPRKRALMYPPKEEPCMSLMHRMNENSGKFE